MVTMTDVAKHAGVSKMTVSRVLNNNGYVKEETRQAVLEAVKALDYRPNLLAKSLVTGRTHIIAYALPDIGDPFFGNVCKGTTDVCDEMGYNSIITNAANPATVDSFLHMVIDRKIDGVIFHHMCLTGEQIQMLTDHGVATVLIDNEALLDNAIDIANDNYDGACMATEYLISRGYRRIACVRGNQPGQTGEDMSFAEGFQERIWQDRTSGFDLLWPRLCLSGQGFFVRSADHAANPGAAGTARCYLLSKRYDRPGSAGRNAGNGYQLPGYHRPVRSRWPGYLPVPVPPYHYGGSASV